MGEGRSREIHAAMSEVQWEWDGYGSRCQADNVPIQACTTRMPLVLGVSIGRQSPTQWGATVFASATMRDSTRTH